MKLKYHLPYIIFLACLVVNTLLAQSTATTPAKPPPAVTVTTTTNLPTTSTIVLPQWGTDLTTHTAELQANPDIRLVLNRNDIFLAETDIAWVESTFAPSQMTTVRE